MCRMGRAYFSGYCEDLVIKFFFFSLLSCIFGFREKRTEHISFLAFQTNFLNKITVIITKLTRVPVTQST